MRILQHELVKSPIIDVFLNIVAYLGILQINNNVKIKILFGARILNRTRSKSKMCCGKKQEREVIMDKTKIKIIIFDMDGVVLDSEPLHEAARQRMFQKMQIMPIESFPSPVGNSASGFWKQVLAFCNLSGDPDALEIDQYRLVAELIEENHVEPSDGLLEVFHWAKSNGMKIALASSSSRVLVDETLRLLKIQHYFDCTVAGDEIETKKPAPDVYLKVLEKTGFSADQAVAVEDSRSGTISAKKAGIYCYGYSNPTSGEQDLQNAGKIIYHLREIIE